jgi:hypothetical protein
MKLSALFHLSNIHVCSDMYRIIKINIRTIHFLVSNYVYLRPNRTDKAIKIILLCLKSCGLNVAIFPSNLPSSP